MAHRNCAVLASVALTLVFPDAIHGALAQQLLQHPGQVLLIEKSGRKPIELEIKAWPESRETGKQGDCPLFGKEPLDATRSKSDGRFELNVDEKKRTYTTTYCVNTAFPRADPDLGNLSNGSAVVPTPVEVFARANDAATYQGIVERKIIGLLNDLAYYQSISPDRFKEAVSQLSSTLEANNSRRAKMLIEFTSFVQQWRQ